MPLPEQNTPWPPPEFAEPYNDVTGWAAWWSGDPELLSSYYGGTVQTTAEKSWAQKGGLVGAIQRFFWGQPTPAGEQRVKLHMPVAAEIAAMSADLLFGAPPAITSEDKTTAEVIGRLMGEQAHAVLYDAAEAGAALGHSYLRVTIDRDVDPDGPILHHVDADAAFPRYAYGRLMECTFLSEYEADGAVWRHLQLHTRGLVEHALYVGDHSNIGKRVPLDEHEATYTIAPHVELLDDDRQGVKTQLERLDVVGIPNARTRRWRHNPAATHLGRADISGVEPALDAIDDGWTSWMRDLRHGRSRIHVPQHYLQSQGPGKGATFDVDRELYVGLQAMAGTEGLELTATQFAIRYAEHDATVTAALMRAYSGAGYSPQTFGLGEVAAMTAAESWNRNIRTQHTRMAKVRRWRPGLGAQLVPLLVEADRVHFRGKGDPKAPVQVEFQASVTESLQSRAQSVTMLSSAKAASTKTLVRIVNPDWDDDRVDDEVALIEDSQPAVPNMLDAFHPPGGEETSEEEEPAEDEDAEGDEATDEEAPPAEDEDAA